MCTLIRHTICESLEKIKHFRYEWSWIMYENSLKKSIQSNSLLANDIKVIFVKSHKYIVKNMFYKICD